MLPYIRISQLHMEGISDAEINLIVNKGDIIGITGRNGCGKTTLARYLSGQARPDKMGCILINGLDTFSQLDREKLRSICGMTLQSPNEAIVLDNVGRDIVFGTENQGIPSEKVMKRAKFYMKKYALQKKRNSPCSTLSASEKQRSALSAILIMHPEILVMDEPFSMHSKDDISRYTNIVVKSARKRNQTVFIFSKNYDVLKQTDIQYELTETGLREVDIDGFDYLNQGTSNQGLVIERYIKGNDDKHAKGISLHNVSFGYDDNLIIDRVNKRFITGSAYRISGGHGTGKTAYLKLAAGLLKPYEGEVFRSEDTKVGYVYQYPEEGFVDNIVLDDVMFGPSNAGNSRRTARSMAESVLEFVGIDKSMWNRNIKTLSFGEKKKVAIAGAIALNPDFLLMDEPYAGLDQDSRRQIESIIEGLCSEGKCVITVEA